MKKLIYILLFFSISVNAQIINSYAYAVVASGGVPVIESYTQGTAISGGTLTLTKPTGVATNDLLIIFQTNDITSGADSYDDSTFKPTGFTLLTQTDILVESDARYGIFYRVADGSEGATIDCPQNGAADMCGFYIRISGASTSTPIHLTGTNLNQVGTSHPIPSITTTNNNCLALYLLSGDGGDMFPFSVSGTGWTQVDEAQYSTGSTVSSGCWGSKDMPTAGATGNATVASNAAAGVDGVGAVQIAINSI